MTRPYPKTQLPLLTAVLTLTVAFAVSACGGSSSDGGSDTDSGGGLARDENGNLPARNQCFSIVDGVATTSYDSVVMILRFDDYGSFVGRCTGTWIGHNTLITAAHCVGATNTGNVAAAHDDCTNNLTTFTESLKVFHGGYTYEDFASAQQTGTYEEDMLYSDSAILLFPDDTAEATTSISANEPQIGDKVSFIGFGLDVTVDDPAANTPVGFLDILKLYGSNTLEDPLDDVSPSRTLVAERNRSAPGAAPDDSVVSFGDSGGPLLYENGITGIASTAGLYANSRGQTIDISSWINLFAAYPQALMQRAIDGGAKIEGFPATTTNLR